MKAIILGGGFCGSLVAKKLEKNDDIETVLIDKKSFFEYQPGLHKVISKPLYLQRLRIKYSSFLKNTKIIVDNVKQADENFIWTDGRKISYDFLIVSTGVDYPIFLKNKQNVYVLKNGLQALKIAEKIKKSDHVLIVGGGVIGTEITGEIIEEYPNKKITVVHSHKRLLERMPKSASDFIYSFFEKNNVETIFKDKVVENKSNLFITEKGKEIFADLCIWCAGIKFNPFFMNKFPGFCFSEKNALKVNNFLQLKGFENIYVGGDITGVSEEKTARKAKLHADVIVENIERSLHGKPLVYYKKRVSPMVVSLGGCRGLILYKFVLPGLVVPGLLKSVVQNWFMLNL